MYRHSKEENMKLTNKYSVFLLITFAIAGITISCSEDDSSGGAPKISYIRVTDPAVSDSLLVAAGQGQMVAIIGENLKNVTQLWVNDQRASLNPSFITNTSIITRIPTPIPNVVTNEMRLVFANGNSLSHTFLLDISEPVVSYMRSEYVNTGDIAVISGDFFYEPLTVTFEGGVQGELVSVTDKLLEVRVPEGAQPGPIIVTTNFGATVSDFWFRDNRNLFAGSETTTNGWWHGSTFIVSTDAEITPISGKFIRINRQLQQYAWLEFLVAPTTSDIALGTKNIPADAILNPEDYYLKVEVNTLESLTGAVIKMYIGNDMSAERGSKFYSWTPNINTNGKWETVALPFDVVLTNNKTIKVDPNGYGVSFWFDGPTMKANVAFDNFRVVPKTIQ